MAKWISSKEAHRQISFPFVQINIVPRMNKHQILVLLPILPMFSVLSADYGRSAFAPDFDPWTHVDVFSRSLTYNSLSLSYNVVKAGPKVGAVRVETSESSGVVGKSAVQIPSAFKRKRSGNSGNGPASPSLVEERAVFGSKN